MLDRYQVLLLLILQTVQLFRKGQPDPMGLQIVRNTLPWAVTLEGEEIMQ